MGNLRAHGGSLARAWSRLRSASDDERAGAFAELRARLRDAEGAVGVGAPGALRALLGREAELRDLEAARGRPSVGLAEWARSIELDALSLGREVNDGMAGYGAQRLSEALGGLAGKRVLILGLAYRGGVKEAELSSTLLLADALRQNGAVVLVNDPLYTNAELSSYGLDAAPLPPAVPIDAAVLQAAHPEYAGFDYGSLPGCKIVLDGRGALARATIEGAGLRYLAIGEP